MFDRLAEYLNWANRKVLDSIKLAKDVPSEVLVKFTHILAAEEIWVSRLKGIVPTNDVWPPPASLDTLLQIIERNFVEYQNYTATLTPELLASSVRYSNSKGEAFESRVSDVLIHVISHGNYHRGQIAVSLNVVGSTPATTDYIFFTRKNT